MQKRSSLRDSFRFRELKDRLPLIKTDLPRNLGPQTEQSPVTPLALPDANANANTNTAGPASSRLPELPRTARQSKLLASSSVNGL